MQYTHTKLVKVTDSEGMFLTTTALSLRVHEKSQHEFLEQMLKFFYNAFENLDLQSNCSLHTAQIVKFYATSRVPVRNKQILPKKIFEMIECEVV